jgi:hypothetical protein
MPPSFIVPDVKEISKMLGILLGREVKVAKGDRIRTGARDKYTLGVFVAENQDIVGVCVTDFPLASNFGAALSLFPPHKAKKCIDEGEIEATIWENTLEVYNVVSRYFHDAHEGMVQLGPTWRDGEQVPVEVRKFMRASTDRVDLIVNINGYGHGAMALIG